MPKSKSKGPQLVTATFELPTDLIEWLDKYAAHLGKTPERVIVEEIQRRHDEAAEREAHPGTELVAEFDNGHALRVDRKGRYQIDGKPVSLRKAAEWYARKSASTTSAMDGGIAYNAFLRRMAKAIPAEKGGAK